MSLLLTNHKKLLPIDVEVFWVRVRNLEIGKVQRGKRKEKRAIG